ncbi:LacI family DNA-binding transcriptional regulator [Paenibacillus sp. GCM10027626]|uniref:LacI family DNA-binding transcriptional regulator n=1 Tax=Paenibacillus sp. GCM10027626 TaxID=3273411 RepID=UPI003625F435
MKKKTTLQDISQVLGISVTAVSKALRGHKSISAETKRLVLETAKKLDYKGQPINALEEKTYKGKVYIIVDQRVQADPYTISACFTMDTVLKSHGLEVILSGIQISEPYDRTVAKIRDDNPAAIVLFGRFSEKMAEEFRGNGTPIITLDNDYPYFPVDSVLPNDYYGTFLAVRHFVQAGHTKIGFIGDNRMSSTFRTRYHGFCDALEHWGLENRPEYIYDARLVDSFGEIQFNAFLDKLDYDRLPTAFFCANDPIAIVLNNHLNARGIRTPDAVSIIGFDNIEACEWQSPPLTSVNYPREHVALRAVELLLWRLDNKEAPCNKILIQPKLTVRQSVAPPKKISGK